MERRSVGVVTTECGCMLHVVTVPHPMRCNERGNRPRSTSATVRVAVQIDWMERNRTALLGWMPGIVKNRSSALYENAHLPSIYTKLSA